MSTVAVGSPIPDLEIHTTGDARRRLSDFRGKALVLYFYPKASTPGCTRRGSTSRPRSPSSAAAARWCSAPRATR